MVSVGILGMIMVLVWSSTSQSLRSKDRIEARDLVFHSGQVALRKLADDVAVAFIARASTTTPSSSTATPTPSPTATSAAVAAMNFKTFFIGEDGGDRDALRFTSLSHMRLMRNAKESDQVRISYEVVPHPEERDFFNLIRREQPWLDNTTEVQGRAFTLAEKIKSFELEYYDERKNDWGKEWDTTKVDWKDRMPMAVRAKIIFADPEDDEREIPLMISVMPAMWNSPLQL
jgi:hypothetical protein